MAEVHGHIYHRFHPIAMAIILKQWYRTITFILHFKMEILFITVASIFLMEVLGQRDIQFRIQKQHHHQGLQRGQMAALMKYFLFSELHLLLVSGVSKMLLQISGVVFSTAIVLALKTL